MGLEWILRMSRRACSFGSSISTTESRVFSIIHPVCGRKTTVILLMPHRLSYGFYDPACRAAAGPGPECRVCWWPWSSWLCAGCQSRPSGSAADRAREQDTTINHSSSESETNTDAVSWSSTVLKEAVEPLPSTGGSQLVLIGLQLRGQLQLSSIHYGEKMTISWHFKTTWEMLGINCCNMFCFLWNKYGPSRH